MKPFNKNKNFNNKKKSLSMKVYEKSFETLNEMLEEFKALHPEMSDIFKYDYKDTINPKEIGNDILEYFVDNAPDIVEGKNLPLTVSVSANSAVLKTAKFFSFRYSFKYDQNGFVTDIKAAVTVFIRERNTEDLEIMLDMLANEDNGWAKVEKERERH
jgi:hypothetical protein